MTTPEQEADAIIRRLTTSGVGAALWRETIGRMIVEALRRAYAQGLADAIAAIQVLRQPLDKHDDFYTHLMFKEAGYEAAIEAIRALPTEPGA